MTGSPRLRRAAPPRSARRWGHSARPPARTLIASLLSRIERGRHRRPRSSCDRTAAMLWLVVRSRPPNHFLLKWQRAVGVHVADDRVHSACRSACGGAGLVEGDRQRLVEHRVADHDDRRAGRDRVQRRSSTQLSQPSKSARPDLTAWAQSWSVSSGNAVAPAGRAPAAAVDQLQRALPARLVGGGGADADLLAGKAVEGGDAGGVVAANWAGL